MAKKKKRLGALLLVFTAVAAGYIYLNIGGFITRTAEKIASDALGVAVNIGSVDLSLSEKKVTVHTIEISNPPGYQKTYAMTAEAIIINLNTASKKLIDFKDIAVKGSVINLEVNENGMNLDDLKTRANAKEQKDSVGSEQVRVIIQNMVIDAATINPSITMLKRDIPPIKMPAISFSNIGKGAGISAGDAIEHIVSKYLSAAEDAAHDEGVLSREIPGLNEVKKTLDDAANGLQRLFK